MLTDWPGKMELEEFTIKLLDEKLVKLKPYPLPYAKLENDRKEIQTMIELGIIEPAELAYSYPVLLVQSNDRTYRFGVDYRKLNRITEFQLELLSDPESIFEVVTKEKYFSKIDLSKVYWQIPVRKEDREKLAFATPDGTYQWIVMPFGVQNALGIFMCMMRKLLRPLKGTGLSNFIDDLLLVTEIWDEHIIFLLYCIFLYFCYELYC
ncbi:hypothetical protein CHS0354_018738 [Potamilus streckersoni]|uniref:Reverse transcriptase domain-containing protein n=1 Tax=Potamilus streckersoni TaxID=2493646 RepID=A0AAE0W6H2_9BIVA|nr:hypothetical protein CHS0354_018738 [Potamilus streckersoni]